jgi:S1-C subfamily serine protease
MTRPRITLAAPALAGAILSTCAFTGALAAEEGAESAFRAAREYTVRVRTVIETPFYSEPRSSIEGAGFLVDARRGWVVTNAHVAAVSPSEVELSFADGEYEAARKLYVDPFSDIAVLSLDRALPGRRPAKLERRTRAVAGEPVGAYGHPMGLPFTGTRGIVSAHTYQTGPHLIQMDATVDHGNSGGPVIGLRDGQVLGIATALANGDRHDRMNFATPIDEVQEILHLLREGKDPSPPRLSFSLLMNEDGEHTMRVAATFDSVRWPFRAEDRLIAVEGQRDTLAHLSDLHAALRGRDGIVSFRVERNGRLLSIGTRPERWKNEDRGIDIDGALIAPLPFDVDVHGSGPIRLIVHSVNPASDANALGFSEGDQVWTIDGRQFTDFESVLAHVRSKPKVPLRVVLRRMSAEWHVLYDYHARELPNESVNVVEASPHVAAGD